MQMLKDKTALITGGTAGIGRAIAHTFAKQGAFVVLFGTNAARGEAVVASIGPERARFLPVDVSSSAEVKAAIGTLGTIDILVNNAGIVRDQLLMKMSEEDWDQVLDTNLKSVYNLCQALVRSMMKARRGKVINISSVVGLTGNAGQVNYAASKAGMLGFTKALAKELASRNIQVNAIAPGYIATPMTEGLSEELRAQLLKEIPMGRMGTPEEIADAALFLASDLSNYITGQVLTVDGGMVM